MNGNVQILVDITQIVCVILIRAMARALVLQEVVVESDPSSWISFGQWGLNPYAELN